MTGSETLLARMVDNVIENAVRHNQPHGSITVALEPHGEHARLVVESGGPILDQATVARLAEPFKRIGAEHTGSENGHGLGLSIVAAVVAAHDGTLELNPRPQGGLRVQITLPAATVANPRAQPHESSRRRRRAPTGEHDRRRVARPGDRRRRRLRRPRRRQQNQPPPLRRRRARPRPPRHPRRHHLPTHHQHRPARDDPDADRRRNPQRPRHRARARRRRLLPKPFHIPELILRVQRSPAANPRRAAARSKRPASNSTHSRAPSPATDDPSSSPQKSAPCSKPS